MAIKERNQRPLSKRRSPMIVLASASAVRQRLLHNAGISVTAMPASIDEAAIKSALQAEEASAQDIAVTLAELKALRISASRPGDLVIGADQLLVCNGIFFDKPPDLDHAAASLKALRGKTHLLVCGVAIARDGAVIWRHVDQARLTMRSFSDAFLQCYLQDCGAGILASVGAYQLEGRGSQLFSRIDGDYFTILGLPLLPLMDFLRGHGALPT